MSRFRPFFRKSVTSASPKNKLVLPQNINPNRKSITEAFFTNSVINASFNLKKKHCAFIALAGFGIAFLYNEETKNTSKDSDSMRKEKQVIVVLGGGINPDGTLRNPSLERVKLAALLYQKGIASKIIVSAKYSYQITFVPKGGMTIAEAMKIKLIEFGIPEDCIIKEDESGDTIFNIYNTKQILKKYNWHTIQIVTSSFQLERARFLCSKILGPDYEVDYSIAYDGLSNDDLSIQNKNEQILLTKTQQAFDQIKDGDEASIIKLLHEKRHPDVTKHNPTSLWHSLTPAPFHRPGLQENNSLDLKETTKPGSSLK